MHVFFVVAWASGHDAMAHVKWFASYDLRAQPQSIAATFADAGFMQLLAIALAIMGLVAWIDLRLASRTPIDTPWRIPSWQPRLLRVGTGVFFLLMALLPVSCILTPELVTPTASSLAVRATQLIVAAATLFKHGAIVGCLGILFLFAQAIGHYGAFHLLDYPIFVAIAGAWVLYATSNIRAQRHASLLLRIGVALTLMWGAIEKLLYPAWGEHLFEQPHLRALTMGFTPAEFIRNAAFVEFSCAFLLLVGRLSSRVSAAVLLFFLIAAIFWFGPIDALGHLLIVVTLVIVMSSGDEPIRHLQWAALSPLLVPVFYLAMMLSLPSGYVALYRILPPASAPLQQSHGVAVQSAVPDMDHSH